jgi:eukaryotic-like serine/threonine-protein kinase
MPQQVPLRPGDPRRLGRYRLGGRILGIPSDDPVFIGLGPDGREVAVSLLRGDWAHDGAARDRFAAEAAVAKRVPPFCAARVLDAGLDGQDAYLVSEYVPGPSLLELVAADGVCGGDQLDAVAIAMATGLASVHQAGLVHGNFGPEYVVMAPEGPPRVIEYGITPPYGAATPSADMLAWAQTVVFAAAGRPPARLDDLDVLPEHVRRPVEQCLDPDPAERPAARAVVLNLLGDAELPGGVLAEGSRRAARAAGRASYDLGAHRSAGPAPDARQAPPWERSVSGPDNYREHRGHGDRPPPRPGRGGAAAYGTMPPSAADSRSGAGRGVSHGGASHGGVSHGGVSHGGTSHGGTSRGGGRRTVWLIAAAVVVAVVVAGVVVHLAQGGQAQPSAHSSLSARTGRSTSSPSPSLSASRGPVTPVAFAGSWSGLVTQGTDTTYNVRVTLTTGANSGTIRYSGAAFSCSGDLDLVSATTAELTLNQGITHGKCANGKVTLTHAATDAIGFRFSGDPVATGTLNRR